MILENYLFVTTTIVNMIKVIFYIISLKVFTGHDFMLADVFEGYVPTDSDRW